MRRREFVTFLGGAAVAWPVPLRAQEAGKSYRVAYLTLAGGQDAVIVKQRLKELGYSEGKNLIFDYRSAEGKMERLPQLAAESAATNPDVIVAGFGRRLPRRRKPPAQPYLSFSPAQAIQLEQASSRA
jgi:putative ABC transport system substrate-binding protein